MGRVRMRCQHNRQHPPYPPKDYHDINNQKHMFHNGRNSSCADVSMKEEIALGISIIILALVCIHFYGG